MGDYNSGVINIFTYRSSYSCQYCIFMFNSSKRPLLPENIENLSPYIAGKTVEEVRQAYRPERISKLASNENRLGCSPKVKSAVIDAIDEIQDYPDPVARQLRAALAKRNEVQSENIIVAGGSESLIAILCRTFFHQHEEAITADATFVGFFVQMGIRGVSLKTLPVTDDYKYDLDAMAAAISDNTKLIYIANPNNPTGTYITKKEFERFIGKVPGDILVIMDEAYYEFAEGVEDYPHALDYGLSNVLSLRTFSKAYGLAGFRIGYAVGHEKLIGSMMKTKLTFEPTALAQAAALAALEDQEFLRRTLKMTEEGKQRLYQFFNENDIEYIPSVSNSVLMELPSAEEAKNFAQQMLEEGVILRRVNAFGLPNCIRVTVGTKDEMRHFEESFRKVKG